MRLGVVRVMGVPWGCGSSAETENGRRHQTCHAQCQENEGDCEPNLLHAQNRRRLGVGTDGGGLIGTIAAVIHTVTKEVRLDAKFVLSALEVLAVVLRILDGCDNEAEAVRDGAPGVGDVFQCHEVGVRINRANALLRVPAGQVCLVIADRMSTIVDVQMIVAVQL